MISVKYSVPLGEVYIMTVKTKLKLPNKLYSVGPFYSCNPRPSGSKPPAGVGMFDWVANAVYQGPSSTLLPGIPLDVWASNFTVSHTPAVSTIYCPA